MGLFSRTNNEQLTASIDGVLSAVVFPESDLPLAAVAEPGEMSLKKGHLILELVLAVPCNSQLEALDGLLTPALTALDEVSTVTLSYRLETRTLNTSGKMAGIRQIVLVASGKGGVGKSTTSVNLALALASEGAAVGILDADIYGPSLPIMLGAVDQKPVSNDGKLLQPLELQGLAAMSLGFLVDPEDATVWRGPMAGRALQQLMFETDWPELDYLIVDMPPGTGDIQLTMSQQVPVSGAVVVTTPQDLALADAQKGIAMFDKVQIPVLGVVENMSYHRCSQCGHTDHIFGARGGEKIAASNQVKLLGQLPLSAGIREQTDSGRPTVAAAPDSDAARAYLAIARQVALELTQNTNDDLSIEICQD